VQVERVAIQAVEAVLARAKNEIDVALSIDDAVAVRADEQALEQILVNLVENAVKYTEPGGHVEVSAVERERDVRIEVKDDGPGIPETQRERIFERFYRVDGGRSKQMGGTGLGLSIVKNLVLAMDGEVGVEGNTPQGAVFWVDLPVA
jgi:two-component system phosphate regulon sensor histidine kinase PhoR